MRKSLSYTILCFLFLGASACKSSAPAEPAVAGISPIALAPSASPIATQPPQTRTTSLVSQLTESRHGITVTVSDVAYSSSETVVKFSIQVDPSWSFRTDTLPPQQAIHRDPKLTDETGRTYAPRRGMYGLPQFDPATGGVKLENSVTFEPIAGSQLSFEVGIELTEVFATQPISITLANRKPGDAWAINEAAAFQPLSVRVESAKLLQEETNQADIEVTFTDVASAGLVLTCVRLFPDPANPNMEGYPNCSYEVHDRVASVSVSAPNPTDSVNLGVAGVVALQEPFRFTWTMLER